MSEKECQVITFVVLMGLVVIIKIISLISNSKYDSNVDDYI